MKNNGIAFFFSTKKNNRPNFSRIFSFFFVTTILSVVINSFKKKASLWQKIAIANNQLAQQIFPTVTSFDYLPLRIIAKIMKEIMQQKTGKTKRYSYNFK